jgi:hypothetical protein
MIVKIEENKIKKIKIGNMFPSKGEIFFPYDWGTDDIYKYISNVVSVSKNEIDSSNPEKEFYLLEIK